MQRVSWLFKLTLVVVVSGLGLAAVTVGVVPRVVEALHAHDELPITLPPFSDLAQRTYVYDAAGNEIAFFERENSQPIDVSLVPEPVIAALLAVEDTEFYQHHGVNLRSLVRAILANVESGTSRQGASTITQQVVKLEYLSGLERDARYKLLQARYAVLLEKEIPKSKILERYLNTIYLGNNAYGIQAAAETYFGKEAKDLTMVEGAFLAGLVRAPSTYDPIRNPERSRARFKQVMRRIAEVGLMDPAEAEQLGSEWPLPEKTQRAAARPTARTYFTETVKDYLLNRTDILGEDEQSRVNALFRGGLRIYTTLDSNLQALAEQAKRDQLPANATGIEAAMTTLDTATGAVRAMVGGAGFQRGVNEVNLALRPRQTGSSIKIFVLSAAIEAGAQPTDVIDGTLPCTLPNPGDPKDPFVITSGVSKAPATLQEMTWSSINCAFARLSQIVGLSRVVDTTYRMSHSPYLTGDPAIDGARKIEPFASYATGANEMSSLDMAAGGQTIANHGLHHDPYFVERIDGPDGTVVYQHELAGVQVLTPEAADTTVDILRGVLTRGTARNVGGLDGGNRPAAGKTGTQDNNSNAWFVGFTPQLTTAVWVGDPKAYTPMVNIPEFRAVGVGKVQGGTFPARIWKAFMEPAHFGLPAIDWPAPPPPARRAARLYLPGNECLARSSSGAASTATTVAGEPPAEAPPAPVYQAVDPGTTIPPEVLDPEAPMPSVANGILVYNCARGLPRPPTPTTAPAPATTVAEAPPPSGG
ncbi:MAG: transglycosylase domain-containing protein [Acidimicrobiia bacterium]